MSKQSIASNLQGLQQKIQGCAERSGRAADDIRLVAVSKTRSLEEVEAVASLGHLCFGENTIQDAMTKIPYLGNRQAEWHFIGHLQSKKAGKIPGYFQWVHSVDSVKLAQKLSGAMLRNANSGILNCLIQVNVSAEKTKTGLLPGELKPYLEQVLSLELPGLCWRGLMTIGVRGSEAQTREAFAGLRALQQACQAEFGLPDFDQLSMGMSGDYCLAIEEGATIVRVGTAIFGERATVA